MVHNGDEVYPLDAGVVKQDCEKQSDFKRKPQGAPHSNREEEDPVDHAGILNNKTDCESILIS
jgi:hypothetical protein